MKQYLLNLSGFGVAALAMLFLLPSSIFAQQGQLYSDGCYYATVGNPMIPSGQPGSAYLVRQGCMLPTAYGNVYYDDNTRTFRVIATGLIFAYGQNGRPIVWTNKGWMDAAAFEASRSSQAQSARAATTTPTATPCVHASGSGVIGGNCPTGEKFYPEIFALQNRINQTPIDLWLK